MIVVAAKPRMDQEWLADAAVEVALPRAEYAEAARTSAEAVAERIRAAGVETTAESRPGAVVRGILLYAEEQDADLIVVGATSRGRVAQRLLGAVPLDLVGRSRRPVLVVSAPPQS
jgi:nucleotide-binding universal stress UspA family protein